MQQRIHAVTPKQHPEHQEESCPDPITQVDLDNLLRLKADGERIQRLYSQIAASVLRRHRAGYPSEDGPRSYEVEVAFDGGQCTETLVVR